MGRERLKRYQVIVIGAGPVGSVAAYRLAERGIDVLLLEANSYCVQDMRASTFHPPTIDMMETLGVLDQLEDQGIRAPIYQYRNRRSGSVLSFDLGELSDTLRHPYRLQCEQYKLSILLTDLLREHPYGQVKFSRRVVSFEQDESGVTVFAEAPFEIEQYRADYVIATDGANSLMRKWLGIDFDGFTYPEKFLTLSTAYPIETKLSGIAHVNYIADPEQWCVVLRVPNVWRVLVPASQDQSDKALTSDAKKNEIFGDLIGEPQAVVTQHRTIYNVHQRVAQTYRGGRVLLAGDAAHLNNPLGGLGMNSGIHDSWMLTDQLCKILHEKGDADLLLDQYVRERRKVMNDFVQVQTIQNKQAMESRSTDANAKRQAELERISRDDRLRRDFLLTQAMCSHMKSTEAVR